MNRLPTELTRIAAACFVALAFQSLAHGQVGRYGATPQSRPNPYQQRLSPYLDLLRSDNSVLSPYHSFVLPRRQVQRDLQQQGLQIRRLEQRTFHIETGIDGRSGSRLPTGRGGTFNNHLHYYRFNDHLQTK